MTHLLTTTGALGQVESIVGVLAVVALYRTMVRIERMEPQQPELKTPRRR